MKTLAMITVLLSALAFAAPAARSSAHAEAPAATKTLTLQILGMVTPNCPVLVKAAVSKIAGVQRVDASLESKTATVRYVPGKTSPEQIRKVIKDQVGFDSKVLAAQ